MVRHNYCTCVNDLVTNGAPKGFARLNCGHLTDPLRHKTAPVTGRPDLRCAPASEDDEQKRI